jgi:hypothetical protein
MSKATDEQAKLTATFINGIAIAMIVLGFIAPLIAFTYSSGHIPITAIVVFGYAWVLAAVVIHVIARLILKDLDR